MSDKITLAPTDTEEYDIENEVLQFLNDQVQKEKERLEKLNVKILPVAIKNTGVIKESDILIYNRIVCKYFTNFIRRRKQRSILANAKKLWYPHR
jgi:hypothetical protein